MRIRFRHGLTGRFLLACAALLALAVGLAAYAAWVASYRRAAERALDQRDFAAAREQAGRYLALWPGPGRARGHLLAARAARRSHLYDEAEEHLRACQRRGENREVLEVERLLANVQRGDGSSVGYLWGRVEAGDPAATEILEVLTQFYLDTYRLVQALQCLNRYLEVRPDDLSALLGRAYVWERFLYFADALRDYRRAVACHPDNDPARLRLAQTLLLAGTPGEALEHLEQLRPHHPDDPDLRLALARCLRKLGRPNEAGPLLDGLLSDQPDRADVRTERGLVALDQGEEERAEALFRQAVARAPWDRQATYNLQQCLLRRGQRDEADACGARLRQIDADLKRLDELSKAVMKAPDNPELRCEAGLLFLRSGEPAEGVRWLQAALRRAPALRPAHRALAEHYRRTGRPDLADHHARLAGPS